MGPRAPRLLVLLLPALLRVARGPAANASLPGAPPNGTRAGPPGSGPSGSAALRSLLVLAGLGGLAALYFLIRACRRREAPGRRYGLLASSEDPADSASPDSDEETVFDTRSRR